MFNALTSCGRIQPKLFSSTTLPNQIGRKATGIRFIQEAVPEGSKPEKTTTEQNPKPSPKIMDPMSSFGEGYATRSDEAGFSGSHGENQYLNKQDEKKIVDGKTPANEVSQGKPVNDKDKAPNQKTR